MRKMGQPVVYGKRVSKTARTIDGCRQSEKGF